MAVLVQKQAGTLSTLKSGNQFYETVFEGNMYPDNTGANNNGYVAHSSYTSGGRHIHFTPTKAGNIQGIILQLYCISYGGVTAIGRNITVELEENVAGTWTSRLSESFHTDDFTEDNTWVRTRGLIDLRFSSTYAITTDADMWRFKLSYLPAGTNSGTFYWCYSQNGSNQDNIFFIPYIDSTVTLTSSDTLVLTDKLTLDGNLSLAGKSVASGTQSGLSAWNRWFACYTCMAITKSGSETTPQIYVPSSVAGDYKLDLDGSWYFGTDNVCLLVGEDEDNPIPFNWSDRTDVTNRKFELLYSRVGTNQQSGFIGTGSVAGSRYGNAGGWKMFGTTPNRISADMKSDALASQDKLILKGDVTDYWAIGDYLMIGGGQYSNTHEYMDYGYSEYRSITALTYSSGTDSTEITLNSNLSYNHYILADDSYIPTKVTLATRNIDWGGTSTTYNRESYNSCNAVFFKLQGVNVHDIHYGYYRYTYKKYHSPAQKARGVTEIKGCNFHECFYANRFYYSYLGIEFDSNTNSSPLTGTVYRNYNCCLVAFSSGAIITNNVLVGRAGMGISINNGNNNIVSDNYIIAQWGINLVSGTASNTIERNVLVRCRGGLYVASCNYTSFKDNIFRKCRYNSSYTAGSETTHGAYVFVANYANIENVSENDDADDGMAFVVGSGDSFSTHTFKNSKLGTNWTDDVVNEGGSTFRSSWVVGSEYKFEDYNGTVGLSKAWYTNGYIESCGTGLDDTTSHTVGTGLKSWRFNTYFADKEHSLSFKIPIGVADEPITISVFCKINSLNYAGGTYNPPKLSISGLGVTGVGIEKEADVTTTDWQLLVVSGSPTSTGQLTVKLSIETDEITTKMPSLNSDGSVYFDDMYISYKTPLDLGGLNLIYNGLPIFPPLTVVMTASAVWAEQTSANKVTGSFGEAVGLIKKWVGWLRSLLNRKL